MSAELFEFTFPFTHHYDVSLGRLPPRPGYPPVFYYPGGTREGGKHGPIFTITPQTGASWVGVFAYGGYGGPPAVEDQVIGWPHPEFFCVVSEGRGSVVQANKPTTWFEVGCYPITEARAVADEGLILFADFTYLLAYGASGIAWRTGRLSWYGLSIEEIREGHVRGYGWNEVDDSRVDFWVDVKTGHHEGGADPGFSI